MQTPMRTDRRLSVGQTLLHGIIGGIVAGVVFILFEMLIAGLVGGNPFRPLLLISTIVLGTGALTGAYAAGTAIAWGLLTHAVLSIIFGVVFVILLDLSNQVRVGAWQLLFYGSIYGFALWVFNFLVIAPAALPQFTQIDPLWSGFIAHTFFYGTVIGAYIAGAIPDIMHRESESQSQQGIPSHQH